MLNANSQLKCIINCQKAYFKVKHYCELSANLILKRICLHFSSLCHEQKKTEIGW